MPFADVQVENSCIFLGSCEVVVTSLVLMGFERGESEEPKMLFALQAIRLAILLCRHAGIVVPRMKCLDGLEDQSCFI